MLENNDLLDDNEQRSLGDYSIDICNIVTYIINSLNDYGLEDFVVESKAHYQNQQPTHVVVSRVGMGHGAMELLTLTRNNIDQRIESIAIMLNRNMIDREKVIEYANKNGLDKFQY